MKISCIFRVTESLSARKPGLAFLIGSVVLLASVSADDTVQFNRDVRPILSQNCFRCHGHDANQRKADLRLDQKEGIEETFVGGKLDESEAWRRIVSNDHDEMMPPPKSGLKLKSQEIASIRRWIKEGAKWGGHWSFVPPKKSTIPATEETGRKKNPIDAFIEARLKKEKIAPVEIADRATLIRRLSLDLVGLPPSIEEVNSFKKDRSIGSFEKTVDRLLASPHFGERMALYWLDLVRYADSVGYHKDSHRDCWMYRDYVIQSFNENKPFDRFTVEQLAGDLLKGSRFEQYQWKVASGFNRMIQTTSEGGAQAKEYIVKYAADRVRNTAAIFLGVTMGCCECHDHKYDPLTMKDYYSLSAFFADIKERGVGYPAHTPMPTQRQIKQWKTHEVELAQQRKLLTNVEQQGGDTPKEIRKKIASLEAQIAKISDPKKWSKTLITQAGKPREIRLLARGSWLDTKGPLMKPSIPESFGSVDVNDGRATRLDLANWITSRENPLTARVFVNRIWKLYFGEGISRTLDDLGSQGEWPTHPQLLDWLAVEFMESGWNIKHIVKLIVTSDAYRRSSVCSDELRKRDPENRLLARQSSFRLSAELVRDNALTISGLLSKKMGGQSVKPYQPANYWYKLYKGNKYVQARGEDLYRRGLYTYWRRSFWHPSLRAFDAPSREECVARRPRSNTPQQSLVLLNDPTYIEAARSLATNMIHDGGKTIKARIAFAFHKSVARDPSQTEIEILTKLYHQQFQRYKTDEKAARQLIAVGKKPQPKDISPAELAAWTSVARTILNLHETITRN